MADWEPRFQPCVSRAVGEDGVSLLECVSGPQEHLDAASQPYISVEYLETVELFDPTTESWSELPPMRHPRGRFGCCALPDDRIVVAGGLSNAGPIASCEVLDLSKRQWTVLPSLPNARSSCRLCPYDGGVLLFGGAEMIPLPRPNVRPPPPASNDSCRFACADFVSCF